MDAPTRAKMRYIDVMVTGSRWRRLPLAAKLGVVCAVALGLLACRNSDEPSPAERAAALERYGELPTFSLTDQDEKSFGSTEIRGNVTVLNFIFTRCPTVCPVFTRKFMSVQKKIGDAPVLFVSISVDPTHDTPSVLAKYASEHQADHARWKFLTGDPELIQSTAEAGLKLAMEKRGELEDGTPDIVHATHFVLVDRDGVIRGYYDADVKERRDALALDARALAGAGG